MYECIVTPLEPQEALGGITCTHTPSQDGVIKGIRTVSKRAIYADIGIWGRDPEMHDLGINGPFTGYAYTRIWTLSAGTL